ncbi:MAG: hypothetical protein KUA37_15940 [Desulfomicrobium sp.]|nr:hypothetical protein [Desulfomicrobium sp.]
MKHRHLNHEAWTPAAIDSCITRGRQEDWNELLRAVLDDPKVMEGLRRVAGYELNLESPFDGLCYQEWWRWVQDSGRETWGPNLKNCGGL